MSLARVDHAAEMVSRLRRQFRGHDLIEGYLGGIAAEVQALEDALQDLRLLCWVDTATGDALVLIARLVGQDPQDFSDDVLRRMVKAKIATNRSRGTVEDVIRVGAAFFADVRPGLVITMEQQSPAAIVVHLDGPNGYTVDAAASHDGTDADTLVEILLTFLRRAKAAGVRLIVEWSGGYDETLAFPPCAFLSGSLSGGETTFTVDDVGAWAPSGTLLIQATSGGEVDETIDYTATYPAPFPGNPGFTLATPVAHAHASGAPVTQVSPTPGGGLGDSSNAGTGGTFAGAAS